ncbi:superoxide dismutase family protein [Paenibacillus alvei]|uniref:Superoxide dismutase [Cu-Zn] n=1 Tax=Paenibacillus alvei TaxID=44250 RepID=A0ABT4GZ68_PAEAL|nr:MULTISPECIES: superoxide dismutase family protein [Paenibacillus]EJW15805.1 superoxide dismutase [Paenibacillus alvei DSM 29]MBG9736926.1 superoxide dismutase [Paenibacillus alvei]MBG9746448.1 superoxide dismutase [Paenibacillus alvei]MCY7484572.1 superoxide dismutase family protein [Paenibacillus alvei]MCY9542050.1 superoxide dismutase family protein [Paenibacillus alvei]
MKKLAIACMLASCLLLSACTAKEALAEEKTPFVNVNIINTKGESIGTAQLTQVGNKVQMAVDVRDLSPGKHGIHFHAVGRCDTPDFKTAEAHLNPTHKEHGFENPKGYHSGDLPNLEVGADGKAQATFTTEMVTLEKDKPNSLVKPGGTALIIHAQPDDYKTDPAGNSGDRIACGVIQ